MTPKEGGEGSEEESDENDPLGASPKREWSLMHPPSTEKHLSVAPLTGREKSGNLKKTKGQWEKTEGRKWDESKELEQNMKNWSI